VTRRLRVHRPRSRLRAGVCRQARLAVAAGIATLFLLAAPPTRPAAQPPAELRTETIWIPATERAALGGPRQLRLEATLYRPAGPGPSPLLVFNHGSTGRGRSSPKETLTYPDTARFFVERGWTVLMPMRRGRGASDGEYLERYDCDAAVLSAGIDRAVEDLDAVMAFVAAQSWADTTRLVLGGMSRGGLLSLVYASMRRTPARGIINMAGGWTVEPCDQRIGFHERVFGRAGRDLRLPTLWLYAENDRNYGPAAVRSYQAAFARAGGAAELQLFPPIGQDGHILMPRHPDVWGGAVDAYLARIGLAGPAR